MLLSGDPLAGKKVSEKDSGSPPLGLKYEKLDESRKRSEPDTESEASPESGRLNARR